MRQAARFQDNLTQRSGRANTKMLLPLLVRTSGVNRAVPPPASEVPVLTVMYCLPLMAYEIGYPVTLEPRFTSQRTLPVFWSRARKWPAVSPPNTRPPPVDTSDIVPARCSYFHTVLPVSTE